MLQPATGGAGRKAGALFMIQERKPSSRPAGKPTASCARARVLRRWRGHACGTFADFDAASLAAGIAAGALDPAAVERAAFADRA